jgi:1-acyl-sn-glycerol-3-phosphate acyltransferase
MVTIRPLDTLRLPLRTAGSLGLTVGMYGLLEIDTALSSEAERDVVLHTWMRRYGRTLLKIYGVEVQPGGPYVSERAQVADGAAGAPAEAGFYPGRDARGMGRLFVMNHRAAFDIMLTLAFFEATIVSRADLAGWPVIGTAARRVGTLFVDRSDKRSGAAVVQAMGAALQGGRGVMIYPEGTTFAGDEVRPFRMGGFKAACGVGAEIVPVGVAYAGAACTYVNESFTSHMTRVSCVKHTRAAFEVGAPIATAGQDVSAVRDGAQQAVQALVHRARARLGADG